MLLNKEKIKRWYLIMSCIQLLITTIFYIVLYPSLLLENLHLLFGANFVFHVMYFISFINIWQYKTMYNRGKLQNVVLFGAKAFSICFIVVGPLFSAFILSFSIVKNQPERAIVFFAPMGLFLGGLNIWRFVKQAI